MVYSLVTMLGSFCPGNTDCVVQTRPESCIMVYSLLTMLGSFCPGNTLIVWCKHELRIASRCTITSHVGVILSWQHFDCAVQAQPESCIMVHTLLTMLGSSTVMIYSESPCVGDGGLGVHSIRDVN